MSNHFDTKYNQMIWLLFLVRINLFPVVSLKKVGIVVVVVLPHGSILSCVITY